MKQLIKRFSLGLAGSLSFAAVALTGAASASSNNDNSWQRWDREGSNCSRNWECGSKHKDKDKECCDRKCSKEVIQHRCWKWSDSNHCWKWSNG